MGTTNTCDLTPLSLDQTPGKKECMNTDSKAGYQQFNSEEKTQLSLQQEEIMVEMGIECGGKGNDGEYLVDMIGVIDSSKQVRI